MGSGSGVDLEAMRWLMKPDRVVTPTINITNKAVTTDRTRSHCNDYTTSIFTGLGFQGLE